MRINITDSSCAFTRCIILKNTSFKNYISNLKPRRFGFLRGKWCPREIRSYIWWLRYLKRNDNSHLEQESVDEFLFADWCKARLSYALFAPATTIRLGPGSPIRSSHRHHNNILGSYYSMMNKLQPLDWSSRCFVVREKRHLVSYSHPTRKTQNREAIGGKRVIRSGSTINTTFAIL